jgi:hypothetical protein
MKTLALFAALLAFQEAPPPDRVENWLTDLDELARVISERHKKAFFKISREEWFAAVGDVRKRIPQLKDHEIAVEFMKLAALIGDGHTVVRPTGLRRYPISCMWLKDGLHVVMANEDRRDLLKARVVAVGKTPVEDAARRVGVLTAADNESGGRTMSAHWLTVPEALAGVGLIDDMAKASFAIVDAEGKERVVELAPLEARPKWALAFDKPDAQMPVWRRATRPKYGFEVLADRKALYAWYDACADAKDKPVKDWCAEVLAEIDKSAPERVVFDFRRNGGGNSILFAPMLAGLRKRPESAARGRLFVLVDRPTFSSAIMNAVELKKGFKAILVGLPPGGSLNGYGEVRTLPLPNSKWGVQYSTKLFQLATPGEDVLKPDVEVEPTVAEFCSGADPAFEAALSYKP